MAKPKGRPMIDPEKASEGLLLRAQRKPVPAALRRELQDEAAGLREHLAADDWIHGPAGSKNTPVISAAALGHYELIAWLCDYERRNGQGGLEFGSPGFYYGGPFAAKMMALRDARAASDGQAAAAISGNLRACLALDALSALPVGRLRDRVVGGRPEESETPNSPAPAVAVAGNRWTPEERGEFTSENAHASILAQAIDWPGRDALGKGTGRGAIAALVGVPYKAHSDPADWGLGEGERAVLNLVVLGDVAAAKTAASWVYGVRTARKAEAWRFCLTRTSEGVEAIFFGPWPNPNKPARAATQQLADGTHVGLQPSFKKEDAAAGYQVEIRGGDIWARTDQGGEFTIPRIGGAVLWRVEMTGTDVSFHQD